MDRIQSASRRADVAEIERLSRIAKRVKEIDLHQKSLSSELSELGSMVGQNADVGQSATILTHPLVFTPEPRRGDLEATIDWPACGITRPRAVISEPKASETLVAFVAELVAARGASVLETLAQLRVNRGPLVSGNPEIDYQNSKTGRPYQYQSIPGTKYYVLTHSSTDEKLDVMRMAWRSLGLPPGGLSVRRAA